MPVPFSLMAGVFIGALLSDVSLAAIIQKIFDGMDSEALLAIPFFLLVGELMSSANVVVRIANLSLSLVGHIRGGLSQVVVVFSMFFSEMSGSTTADVAVMSRALGGPMKREGYEPGLHRRHHRLRLDHRGAGAAEHHGRGLWRGRQRLDRRPVHGRRGARPDDRLRPDDLLLFLRPRRACASRARRCGRSMFAAGDAALPLMIPVILLGGILTGWFTPTEAGVVAVVWIILVVIPALNRGHIQEDAVRFLPRRSDLLAAADHHRRRQRLRLDARLSARRHRHRRRGSPRSPATIRTSSCC